MLDRRGFILFLDTPGCVYSQQPVHALNLKLLAVLRSYSKLAGILGC